MKRFYQFLLAAVSCVMLFASCEKESDLLASKLKVSPQEIAFDGEKPQKVSVTVESDGDWLATAPEWITVTPNNGTGNMTVEVTADPNLDVDGTLAGPRNGEIVFQGGEITAKVKADQEGDPTKDLRRTYVKVAEAKGGKAYLIVAGEKNAENAASPLAEDKTYGYLPGVPVEPKDDKIDMPDASKGFIFTAVEGGFTIQDPTGRYYYQTGTYNSFNVAAEMPSEGAVWTVEPQEDGTVKIINASVNKYFQIDTEYGSFGSYDSDGETRFRPTLYEDTKDPEIVVPEPPTPGSGPVACTVAEALEATDSVLVAGTVQALSSRGFVLADETASIMVYSGDYAEDFVVGDVVKVGGKPSVYNYLGQIAPNQKYYEKTGSEEVVYPEAKLMDAAAMDAVAADLEGKDIKADRLIDSEYIEVRGVLSVSGTYYNVVVDGTQCQGSIYYPVAAISDQFDALNGKMISVKGFFAGVSGGKYFNVMATEIQEIQGGEVPEYPAPKEMTIAEAMAQTDSVLVSGSVQAVCARGFVLEDETAATFVYSASYAQDYVPGDQVTVGGKPGAYNYGAQIAPAQKYYEKTGSAEVVYPEPVVMTAEKIAEYKALIADKSSSDPVISPVYVEMTGTVSISNGYYNLVFDGIETEQGSFYQLTDAQKETVGALEGKKVKLLGYFQAISGGGYFNVIMTSVEEVGGEAPELKPSIYGVVGTNNNWGDGGLDEVMYEVNGMYVAENVEFKNETANAFKIRANNTWTEDGSGNFGPTSATYMQNNSYVGIIEGNGAQNMNIAAGTYDIWFDLAGMRAYAMTPGTPVSDAVETWPEEIDPSTPATGTWYLVGDFNGWTPGDSSYLMSNEGSWYVFRNFEASSDCQVKFCDGTWGDNRGGNFAAVNEPIAVVNGGNNIYVPAGTYDVYMDGARTVVYFMTPGLAPGASVETVWGIAGGFNGWDQSATVCEEEGNWWVARNIAIDAAGFKFLKNRAWTVNLTATSTVTPNEEFAVVDGNGQDNIYVDPVGTYDIYLAKTLDKAYVMTPGLEPGEKPAPVFSAGEYYIAAKVDGAYKLAVPHTSSYGYMNVEDALAGSEIAGYKDHVFTFTAVDGGFTIQDVNGKYYYQSGTYNNFSISDSMPAEGAVWTVAENEDGTFTITNTAKNKYIQYSTGYVSFGSYASAQDGAVLPILAPASNAIDRPEPEIPADGATWILGSGNQTWTADTHSTYGAGYAATVDGIKVAYYKHGNNNDARTPDADHIRVYKGSALVVTADGKAITKVILTCTTSSYAADITVNGTDTVSPVDTVITWEGNTTSFEAVTAGQIRIKQMTIVTE